MIRKTTIIVASEDADTQMRRIANPPNPASNIRRNGGFGNPPNSAPNIQRSGGIWNPPKN